MNPIDLGDVRSYIKEHIGEFHKRCIEAMRKTDLKDLLIKKNPYLFKAKHMATASELIDFLLNAKLSSSDSQSH